MLGSERQRANAFACWASKPSKEFSKKFLSFYERKQRHESGTLYSTRNHTLVLCACSGVARIDDLSLTRNETLQ